MAGGSPVDPLALSIEALDRYLKRSLPEYEGPVEARKYSGGQSNPTYELKTPLATYVLRRKPPGQLLKSAHAVDREFRVQRALANTDVPVARMRCLCEDESIIGSVFYIMDHVPGNIAFDPRLPHIKKSERVHFFNEMNRVLAAIHSVDLDALGLADFGPPGNYIARQVKRWSAQYRASETEPISAMDRLIDLLDRRLADGAGEGERTLVHGDFRIDNLIFSESHSVEAVLDWELSTIGHPYADLASVIMQWQMPVGVEGRGLAGVDREAEGLPQDEGFIAAYCERRKIDSIPGFGFFLAFCFFRMGAVLQGVKKRALAGNASNPEQGLKMGAFVPIFAVKGLEALAHG